MRRLALAAALVACSSRPSGDGGGAPVPIGDFATQFPQAFCQRLVTCGLVDASQAAECAAMRGTSLWPDWGSVSATTRSFDAGAGQACLTALSGWDCNHASWAQTVAPACNVLVGTVQPGGACASLDDCAPGLACKLDLGASCGVCSDTNGQACSDSTQCGPSQWCNAGSCLARNALGAACPGDDACPGVAHCLGGKCVGPQPAGKACDGGQTGDTQCVAADWCGNGTCAARGKAGEACATSDQCAGAQRCQGAAGTTPGACATPKKVGAPCTTGASVTGCIDAFQQEVCVAEVCKSVPGLGQTCDPSQAAPCRYGERCDTATKKCAVRSRAGEPCAVDGDCVAGACAAGACSAPPACR